MSAELLGLAQKRTTAVRDKLTTELSALGAAVTAVKRATSVSNMRFKVTIDDIDRILEFNAKVSGLDYITCLQLIKNLDDVKKSIRAVLEKILLEAGAADLAVTQNLQNSDQEFERSNREADECIKKPKLPEKPTAPLVITVAAILAIIWAMFVVTNKTAATEDLAVRILQGVPPALLSFVLFLPVSGVFCWLAFYVRILLSGAKASSAASGIRRGAKTKLEEQRGKLTNARADALNRMRMAHEALSAIGK